VTTGNCTIYGTEKRTCSKCNAIETRSVAGSHDIVPATCTEPVRCTICEFSIGTPIPHSVSKWTITKDATCITTGVQTGECTNCKITIVQDIPKSQHNYIFGSWQITSSESECRSRLGVCGICQDEKVEHDNDHTYNSDGKCIDCSYKGMDNPPTTTTVKLVIGGKVISSARMYNGEPVADFSDLAFTLGDSVMGVPDVRDTITISYRRPDGGYGEVTYNQSDLIHISDHEHWFPIIRMANDMQYGGQVHTFSNSDGSQGIYIDLYSLVQYASPEALLDAAQTGLDLVGLVPVIGEPADGANSLIYLARGDEVNAALSAASLVPIGGWVSTGGKLVNKTIKWVTKYGDDVFEGVVKLTNATEYLSKVSTKTKVVGSYPPSHTASQVLRDELKSAGVATPPYLNAAHHIIPWDDPRALDARKILDEFGIEYNSASNGVFLPMGAAKYVTNETIHVGNHGPEYISYITNALRDVKAAGGNQADIIETLGDIRAKLLDGTLKLN
jgi:hypothetical protein